MRKVSILAAVCFFSLTACQRSQDAEIKPAETTWSDALEVFREGKSDDIDVDVEVSDTQLNGLEAGIDVGHLALRNGAVGSVALGELDRLSSVERLTLYRCDFDDSAAQRVSRIQGLEHLNIPDHKLTGAGLAAIAANSSLRSLRIGPGQLDGVDLGVLTAHPSLEHLHLIGVLLDLEQAQRLAQIPGLQSLYLDDSGLSLDDQEALETEFGQVHMHFNQQHSSRSLKGGHSHE